MRRLGPILIGTIPLWLTGAAFAQATPEGAAALRQGLTAILTPTLATPGLGEPIFEGGWTVEPNGAGYRVTGPALSLALRDDDPDGRKRVVRIRCDGDRYTATAGEAAAWKGAVYRLQGETPMRCEIRPGTGEPPVLFTSRTRRAELTIDLAAAMLTASTDESEGVTVTEDGETRLAMHRLSLTSATTPHPGSGRPDSKQQDIALQFEAEGLSAGDLAAGDGVTLGRLRYGGRLEDVDAAALRDRTWRLIAFALDAAQRDPQAPPRPNAGRKLDALLRQVQGLVGGASQSELVLADLRGTGDDSTTGFDSLTIAGGYRGLDRETPGRGLGGDLTFDLRGFTVADVPGGSADDPGSLAIDRVRLSGTLDPVAGAPTARSALALDIDGMHFALTESTGDGRSETRFDLAKARYAVSADGLDVAGLIAVIGGFQSLVAKHGEDEPPPAELSPWFARIRTTIAALSQYKAEIGLSGLRVRSPYADVAIGGVTYSETYAGLDGDRAGYGLHLGMDELTLGPGLPFGDWVPRRARIDIALKDVPSRSVQALFWDGVEAAVQADESHRTDPSQPDGGQVFGAAMQRVADRLLRSDARLSIGSFDIIAPKGAIDLGGGGTVDPQAVFGVTGQATLRIAGLDDFVKFLQTQPDGAGTAAGITVFQLVGRQAKTAEGKPARDYDLLVDAGGRLLINGTDLATLMPK